MRAIAETVSASDGWAFVFHTAEEWSVPSQLGRRLEECGVKPPSAQWREFQRARIATFARSASKAAKGVAALHQLERAGIPALAFKGLASMATLYTPPASRTIKDADLVVAPGNQRQAVQALEAIGYNLPRDCDLESWDRFLDNSPGFSGNKAIVLTDSQGFEIDLHWSLGIAGMEPEALLARQQTAMLFEKPVPVVSAVDGLLLTTRHSIRENVAIDTICRDLFDVRLGCAHLATRGLLRQALETIAKSRSGVPLLVLTRALSELSGDAGAVSEAARILGDLLTPEERQSADQIQALFVHQVQHGPITKDLLYLFHSRPAKQILTAALTDWREYRKFMQYLEEKLDGAEVPLSRRLRQATTGLKRVGTAQWRGMRELANLKYEV